VNPGDLFIRDASPKNLKQNLSNLLLPLFFCVVRSYEGRTKKISFLLFSIIQNSRNSLLLYIYIYIFIISLDIASHNS
jgi:hypothetical protein